MELHVPIEPGLGKLGKIHEYLTQGLDAVVIRSEPEKGGKVRLTLAGNPRDLSVAAGRALRVGGVVDSPSAE